MKSWLARLVRAVIWTVVRALKFGSMSPAPPWMYSWEEWLSWITLFSAEVSTDIMWALLSLRVQTYPKNLSSGHSMSIPVSPVCRDSFIRIMYMSTNTPQLPASSARFSLYWSAMVWPTWHKTRFILTGVPMQLTTTHSWTASHRLWTSPSGQ